MRVLAIEDDDSYAELVRDVLSADDHTPFEVTLTPTLGEGVRAANNVRFDIVLLDLNLPDSTGIDTGHRFRQQVPEVPVVVVTGVTEYGLAMESLRAGAHDHWIKSDLDLRLLGKLLTHALERIRLARQHRTEHAQARGRRELEALDELSSSVPAPITTQLFGSGALSQTATEAFNKLVDQYARLLEATVEKRIYRSDDHVPESAAAIARMLGTLKAGPRDVIEVHTQAVRKVADGASSATEHAAVEEGRVLVLELMGHLAAYYKQIALPRIGLQPPKMQAEGG
jgi:DNA-binding response OmpR family regulator